MKAEPQLIRWSEQDSRIYPYGRGRIDQARIAYGMGNVAVTLDPPLFILRPKPISPMVEIAVLNAIGGAW